MGNEFAPKDAEILKAEVLEDLGIEYEGNEAQVDKVVQRRLKDEEFKASLHADKNKHLEGKRAKEELLKKAGFDPETGEKLGSKEPEPVKKSLKERILEGKILNEIHEDDVEEVAEYAERKGVPLYEAAKSPYIQAFLKTRQEERKTAEAANTKTQRRSEKPTVDLIGKIHKQELSSKEEMQDAAKAFVQSLKAQK